MARKAGFSRISAGLRVVALLAAFLALFLPSSKEQGRDYFLLLDLSASVRRLYASELEDLPKLFSPAFEGAKSTDRFALLGFASHPELFKELQSRDEFLSAMPHNLKALSQFPPEEATDFEAACRWVFARTQESRPAEIWIYSDALENQGDFLAVSKDAAEKGIALHRLPFPKEKRSDLKILRLTAPQTWTPGVELLAQVLIEGDASTNLKATLSLSAESGVEKIPLQTLQLEISKNERREIEIPFRFDREGDFMLQAELRSTTPDPIPENNIARRFLKSGKNISVGWMGEKTELFERFRNFQGISFYELAPRSSGQWLDRMEVLFTNAIPAENLVTFQAAINQFLRRGGVWMLAGGVDSFPKDGQKEISFFNRCLPFYLSAGENEAQHVLILLDASGSMEGEKFKKAAEAAQALSYKLSTSDRLEAAAFAQEMGETQLWKESGENTPRELQATFFQTRPQGETDLYKSIQQAIEAFDRKKDTNSAKRRLFLLSDGKQESKDFTADWAKRSAERLQSNKVELIAFAIGQDANLENLKTLTSDGQNGRVVLVENLDRLNDLFARESSSNLVDRKRQSLHRNSATTFSAFPLQVPELELSLKVKLYPDAESVYDNQAGRTVFAAKRFASGIVFALASPLGKEGTLTWDKDANIWETCIRSFSKSRSLDMENQKSISAEFLGEGRDLSPFFETAIQPKPFSSEWFTRQNLLLFAVLCLLLSFFLKL